MFVAPLKELLSKDPREELLSKDLLKELLLKDPLKELSFKDHLRSRIQDAVQKDRLQRALMQPLLETLAKDQLPSCAWQVPAGHVWRPAEEEAGGWFEGGLWEEFQTFHQWSLRSNGFPSFARCH